MKRGRGRGGRKPSNNLNRTMESNGPDVKVRGTAHQICEKYQALARDAHASGDRIAHENYLQHAEHYHRIISAAQQAAQESTPQSTDVETEKTPADSNGEEKIEITADDENVAEAEDGSSAEAPRRARRGRRTRTPRSNGNANGSGDETASNGNAEAPAESA